MTILGKAAIAPMLAFAVMFALTTIPAWSHGNDSGFEEHGNNPADLSGVELHQILLIKDLAPGVYWPYLELCWPDQAASQLSDCIEGAQEGCGSTGICSVCVCNGSCGFICRDYFGHCPTNPPACCPQVQPSNGQTPINL